MNQLIEQPPVSNRIGIVYKYLPDFVKWVVCSDQFFFLLGNAEIRSFHQLLSSKLISLGINLDRILEFELFDLSVESAVV